MRFFKRMRLLTLSCLPGHYPELFSTVVLVVPGAAWCERVVKWLICFKICKLRLDWEIMGPSHGFSVLVSGSLEDMFAEYIVVKAPEQHPEKSKHISSDRYLCILKIQRSIYACSACHPRTCIVLWLRRSCSSKGKAQKRPGLDATWMLKLWSIPILGTELGPTQIIFELRFGVPTLIDRQFHELLLAHQNFQLVQKHVLATQHIKHIAICSVKRTCVCTIIQSITH